MVELIKELKNQLKLTLVKYQALRSELLDVKEKHQQAIVEKQKLEDEVRELKEQVKTIKLAQAINGKDDQPTRELKNQINQYIREIDKCLNLINRD